MTHPRYRDGHLVLVGDRVMTRQVITPHGLGVVTMVTRSGVDVDFGEVSDTFKPANLAFVGRGEDPGEDPGVAPAWGWVGGLVAFWVVFGFLVWVGVQVWGWLL